MTDNLHREQWTELSEIDREEMPGSGGGTIKGLRTQPPVIMVKSAVVNEPPKMAGPLPFFIVIGILQIMGAALCVYLYTIGASGGEGEGLAAGMLLLAAFPGTLGLSLVGLVGVLISLFATRPHGWRKWVYISLLVPAVIISVSGLYLGISWVT